MRIPDNLIQYVKNMAAKMHHGRITIEINETANKVDVVVENRERFDKESEQREFKSGEKRNG